MGKLASLFTNREKRMPAVLYMCLILTIIGAVFTGRELIQNRRAYIGEFERSQREETEILKAALEGRTEGEMTDFMKRAFPASGARWAFLYHDKEVVFAQNDTTTQNLGALKETGAFLAYLEGQEGILTVSDAFLSDAGESCYVGIISDRDHALSLAGVTGHEIYIILCLSAVTLIFAGGLIFVTGLLNAKDESLLKVRGELVERNEKFAEYEEERLQDNEDANERRLQDEGGQGRKEYYDKDVFRMLLNKSSDPALFPITFMLARVVMEDHYYGRDEIFGAMDFIRERLKNTQILAELGKGRFAAILYKTELSEAEEQKAEIISAWNESDKSRELKLELKLYPVMEGEEPAEAFKKSGFFENQEE